MKILSITLLFLFFQRIGYSQESVKTNDYRFDGWNYDWSEEIKTAYVFVDACKLRSKPTAGSEVLTKLLIGDRVKVLEISKSDTTINGLNSRWIHVESGKQKGYVWGGLLTNEILKVTDSTCAVWGISRVLNPGTDSANFYASVKVFSKKQIIKQIEFEVSKADEPLYGNLMVIKNPLLEDVNHVFVFNTLAEACGLTWSEIYILESDKNLSLLEEGYGSGEANLYYFSSTLVFPTKEKESDYSLDFHRTPEKNQIFRIIEHDEYDENCVWIEHSKIESFEWKDYKMIPFCRN